MRRRVDNFCPPDSKHWTNQRQTFQGLKAFHSAKSAGPGAAGGPQEKGFKLIIGVVRQRDTRRSEPPKEIVAGFTGGHFNRDTFFFGVRRNVGFSGYTFNAEFFAQRFNESFVAVGLRATNGMVQVRGGQLVSEPMKNMEQRDRISTAGNTNDNGFAGGNKISPLNHRFDFFDQVHKLGFGS